MNRYRLPLATLLTIILVAALGLAALKGANPFVAGAVYSGVVLLLLCFTLRGIAVGARRGMRSIGFAVFGWAYLMFFSSMDLSSQGTKLSTTFLFEKVYFAQYPGGTGKLSEAEYHALVRGGLPELEGITAFVSVGHSMCALALGGCGALIGPLFSKSRRRG